MIGGEVGGFRSFGELIDGQSIERLDDLGPTGSFMFYTSGTTGRVRGSAAR